MIAGHVLQAHKSPITAGQSAGSSEIRKCPPLPPSALTELPAREERRRQNMSDEY